MPDFILDANLSPRVARALSNEFGVDILSLHREGLAHLQDHEIIQLAVQLQRVVITQDGDFARHFYHRRRHPMSVIYVNLPTRGRNMPAILAVLRRFFALEAASIDFLDTLIVLTETEMQVISGPRLIK